MLGVRGSFRARPAHILQTCASCYISKGDRVSEQINIFLTISHKHKGIPYGAVDRPDGAKNHGYKRLKGNRELAATIPEAQKLDALKAALIRLNGEETAFFTVGCELGCTATQNGKAAAGYVELSFNFVELVNDAQHYFKLFFLFNNEMNQPATLHSKARY